MRPFKPGDTRRRKDATATVASGPRDVTGPYRGAKKVVVTGVTLGLAGLFLSPFLFMMMTALMTKGQLSLPDAPIWPAEPALFEYEGKTLDVFQVPMPDGEVRTLAAVEKGRQESVFIDPNDPQAGEIVWKGSWRTLERPWQPAPSWSNFGKVWTLIDFDRLMWNTALLAAATTIGVLFSCILVAYGFARFDFPGRDLLFLALIATIFLPDTVRLIPMYAMFVEIDWVGTYLPLIVPSFFANAYDVFLIRQYMLTIPRELDEAAMIDGAGPWQVLTKVIIPQAKPAIVVVTVFHVVYAWNNYLEPLVYLSSRPDLQPISVGIARFNGLYGSEPTLIQTSALMAMIVPLVVFMLAQRYFMQGIVVTGVDK